jgi:hypothetical protein
MFFSNSKPSSKNSRNRKGKDFGNYTNAVLLIGYLITLPICTLLTLSSIFPLLTASLFTSIESSHYSTSIPWIDNASECQYTGRNWRDRKCWDDQHNPMF